ncbi:hypothetical protein HSEST_0039 [Halapricum desulfuricans]|uniref:Uncharacterized protein n=1 Tax=Halapricum desulfuricans TaxID=2841257 RepID=A0A897NLH9_9EURY|nr:hypothetical protein HSEST_0039 [Halapricum desulfuricans]
MISTIRPRESLAHSLLVTSESGRMKLRIPLLTTQVDITGRSLSDTGELSQI